MSITVAKLVAEIKADITSLKQGTAESKKKIDEVVEKVDQLGSRMEATASKSKSAFETIGASATRAGTTLSIGLTAPILALGKSMLTTAADFDGYRKGLVAVMGSSQAAEGEMRKLIEVAKLPGLGLKEAYEGSIRLQAAGMSARGARESLLSFGNALATVGKGKASLDLVNYALTQITSVGKVLGGDLRQLQNQLPQLRKVMRDTFGTETAAGINKLGLNSEQFLTKLIAGFSKLPKVTTGLKNSLENIDDSFIKLKASVGDAIGKSLGPYIDKLSNWMNDLSDRFKNMNPQGQRFILIMTGLAAAAGPVLLIVGKLASAVSAISTLFGGPLIAAIGSVLPIIMAVAAGAFLLYQAFQTNFAGVRDTFLSLWESIKSFAGEIIQTVKDWVEENKADIIGAWEGIKTLLVPIMQSILNVIVFAWDTIKTVVRFALDTILSVVSIFAKIFTGDWKGIWDVVVGWVVRTWNRIQLIITSAIVNILKILKNVANYFAQIFGTTFDGLDNSIVLYQNRLNDLERSTAGSTSGIKSNFGDMFSSITKSFAAGTESADLFRETMKKTNEEIGKGSKRKGSVKPLSPFDADPTLKDKLQQFEDLKSKLYDVRRATALLNNDTEQSVMLYDMAHGKIYEQNMDMAKAVVAALNVRDARQKMLDGQKALIDSTRELNKQWLILGATSDLDKVSFEHFGKSYASLSDAVNRALVQEEASARVRNATLEREIELRKDAVSWIDQTIHSLLAYKDEGKSHLELLNQELALTKKRISYVEYLALRTAAILADENERKKVLEAQTLELRNQWNEYNSRVTSAIADSNRELMLMNASTEYEKELIQALAEGFDNYTAMIIAYTRTYVEHVKQVREQMIKIRDDIVDVFMDAFDKIYTQGFKNMFGNIIGGFRKLLFDMAMEFIKSRLVELLSKSLGMNSKSPGGGSGFWNTVGSVVGGALGKKRELGGPVGFAQAYVVGERGPEFFVPNVSGHIVTHDQASKSLRSSSYGNYAVTHPSSVVTTNSSNSVANSATNVVNYSPTIHIHTNDPEKFRRSVSSELKAAYAAAETARRRI